MVYSRYFAIMKVFILLSVLGIAAGQLNIQMPVEWLQAQNEQPQENSLWDFRRPVEQPQNQWNQPQQDPWNQPNNQWNQQPWNQPQQDPWNQPQQNPWNQPQQDPWNQPNNQWNQPQQQPNRPGQWWGNQQPIRVPPQPIETEPWLLRPETRCPQPQEGSYNWALIIPHFRDNTQLTVCFGGVGRKLIDY